MEEIRKSFQGVINIVRFNWHFYAISVLVVLFLILISLYTGEPYKSYIQIIIILFITITLVSLYVSFYIYDLSGLYNFKWMDHLNILEDAKIININAGFDESSGLIKRKFSNSELIVLDFYDPLKHTEVSIKRARKAYPPFQGTKQIKTDRIPFPDNSVDTIFAILSAHEIRNEEERILFFKELHRIAKSNGQIIIIEHLQDLANFLAYNIGFYHFHSRKKWLKTFSSSNFTVKNELKITPFISTFILEKNGNTS